MTILDKKILHVGDTKGVASVLAKWQRKMGFQVKVIERPKFDKMGITEYYGNYLYELNDFKFILKIIKLAKESDIIHDHTGGKFGRVLKYFTRKKTVLHYYDSDMHKMNYETRRKHEKHYDDLFISTPNLMEWNFSKDPKFVPYPVDTNVFFKREFPKNNKGLIFLKQGQTKENVEEILTRNNFDLELTALTEKGSYEEFQKIREDYQYYVDLPFHNNAIERTVSLTGLQSLSMGQQIIDYNLKIQNIMPEVHNPEQIVKLLDDKYEDIL